jgi:hypothetical protein
VTHPWRRLADHQAGLLTRRQLAEVGVDRHVIARRVATERWQRVAHDVVAMTTGELTVRQRRWAAVLHGGEGALLSGLSAADDAGLERWSRDHIEVLVPYEAPVPSALDGVLYRRSRRDLRAMRDRTAEIPRCRIEPAVLMFAASERSERTAVGLLAAVVQQRLTSPELLEEWLDRLAPLRRSRLFRATLNDIAGGAQSLGEIDVRRMCQRHRILMPHRQVRRRDSAGRRRFTDCEWKLADGRWLVLEVDGAFHMEVEHWEDDLARQRGLAALDRVIVHCTTRELRDTPELVARDLLALGVPQRL